MLVDFERCPSFRISKAACPSLVELRNDPRKVAVEDPRSMRHLRRRGCVGRKRWLGCSLRRTPICSCASLSVGRHVRPIAPDGCRRRGAPFLTALPRPRRTLQTPQSCPRGPGGRPRARDRQDARRAGGQRGQRRLRWFWQRRCQNSNRLEAKQSLFQPKRAGSSAVERWPYKPDVAGSSPVPPTTLGGVNP